MRKARWLLAAALVCGCSPAARARGFTLQAQAEIDRGIELYNKRSFQEAAQVLEAATRTPGAFIAMLRPETPRFGTIAAGHRADLLLVAANPLDGLATLQSPLGVMSGGRWHDAAALRALLDGVARRNVSALPPPPSPGH